MNVTHRGQVYEATEALLQAATENCQRFANAHKVVFEDHGEVGFGRPCVGFKHGGNYVNYNPLRYPDYAYVWPRDERLLAPPETPDAYHKHDCLAVLVHDANYAVAVLQLDAWVRHLEAQGAVSVVDFQTGATGVQALLSGMVGRAVRLA